MLDIKTLTSSLSVSPQIDKMDLKKIADMGFKTIISNRPDGEAEEQPLNGELGMLSERLGMAFIEQPVLAGAICDEDYVLFSQALETATPPVLAFCRTGTRCTTLWVNGTEDMNSREERLNHAVALGFVIKA
ncbi:TIGR01244 family phosphatase [Vibrio tritonius]|uniref:TIGR01244 family phosphatase n=1 Tax=Vibrio tritonius TaxID=1435069 RepID=A0ABS7YJN1_9VIBR|nr:TIGR01244 family sulfur transferase [Vibrio tritonius]MCA2015856.1 TIGR01244 family phosphatase [Vibrio tritonius]